MKSSKRKLVKSQLKGPILVGGRKSKPVYRQRVIVIKNYVTGQTVTLSEIFPGGVEKVLFSGNCLLVWSAPTAGQHRRRRGAIHRWQRMSCVTIWSRKTGAFLRILNTPQDPTFLQRELNFPTKSNLINISGSVLNMVPSKGSKNIWKTICVTPISRMSSPSTRPKHVLNHEKSGKMAIRNG